MKYKLKIEVSLKPGHSDPEGETAARMLKELGYNVGKVSVSKAYTIILDAESRDEALNKGFEFCKRLLANPTKDNYAVTVEEA